MTPAEKDSYLKKIMNNEIPLDGFEAEVAARFRDGGNKIKLITEHLSKTEGRLFDLKKQFQQLSIEMNTYERLLLSQVEKPKKEPEIKVEPVKEEEKPLDLKKPTSIPGQREKDDC